MRALLVRVGIDQAYGRWNSPVDPTSREFVYVPIPESPKSLFYPGMGRAYREALTALDEFSINHGTGSLQSLRWPQELNERHMHLDPDFESLTYGNRDNVKGTKFRNLKRNDLVVFYAGLRPIKPTKDRLVYALIGIMVVDEVVAASDVPKDRWHENAHTRKSTRGENDIVVRARPGVSGRLAQCIDIGEFRNLAYRVRHDVLKAWGGLKIRDGYLQRSANPPPFADPQEFYKWFHRQEPRLLASNFSVGGPKIMIRPPVPRLASKTKPSSILNNEIASKPKVIIVHLRQPRLGDPNESRCDPFYEFGSFGCTGCHRRNLMNPGRIHELEGARLAIAQGGRKEFRLVLLSPPVKVEQHKDRCEVRWKPIVRPFRFSFAPLLISNDRPSDFSTLVDFLRSGKRKTPCARFSSAFRSRRKELPEHVAAQLVDVFDNHVDSSKSSAFARCYSETMQVPPPRIDTKRELTYQRMLRLGGSKGHAPRLRQRCKSSKQRC